MPGPTIPTHPPSSRSRQLGRNALDLDMGHYRPDGSSVALLYALRLLVRVEGHILHLLARTPDRGTAPGGVAARSLPSLHAKLRWLLWDGFFPTVERWVERALAARDSGGACVLLGHLAFLCKNGHAALDFRQAPERPPRRAH